MNKPATNERTPRQGAFWATCGRPGLFDSGPQTLGGADIDLPARRLVDGEPGRPFPPPECVVTDALAVPIPDAVRLLSRLGGKPISEETIRSDIESGAPVNPDGTLNLVEYAAWLVREMGKADGN